MFCLQVLATLRTSVVMQSSWCAKWAATLHLQALGELPPMHVNYSGSAARTAAAPNLLSNSNGALQTNNVAQWRL